MIRVVRGDDFSISAIRWNHPDGDVVIRYGGHERRIGRHMNSRVLARIRLRDFQRVIGTAIVDYVVAEIAVVLSKDTLDAIREILLAVVNRSQHTHGRTRAHPADPFRSHRASPFGQLIAHDPAIVYALLLRYALRIQSTVSRIPSSSETVDLWSRSRLAFAQSTFFSLVVSVSSSLYTTSRSRCASLPVSLSRFFNRMEVSSADIVNLARHESSTDVRQRASHVRDERAGTLVAAVHSDGNIVQQTVSEEANDRSVGAVILARSVGVK